MAQRKFDPEETQYFKAVLEAELEFLEDTVIKQLKDGVLSYAPAFGITEDGQTKAGEYVEDFNTAWSDLQSLKATLKGMIDSMETALEGHEVTEDVNVHDLQALEVAASGDGANDDGQSYNDQLPE